MEVELWGGSLTCVVTRERKPMTFGKFKDEKDDKAGASSFTPGVSGTEKQEAFLGKGSKIVGTLTFSGPVELDGHIEGEVIAQDRLVIGESGVVQAKVSGAEIVVRGSVTGDIHASRRLALKKPAKVIGNITTASLSIEEGVIFEGKSSMSGSQKIAEMKPLTPKTVVDKVGASG